MLLTNTEPVFEELENHQMALQTMQSSSAAGSFLDEVMKWQKRLQTIEAVLTTWLDVQEKWVELEEVKDIQLTVHDVSRNISYSSSKTSFCFHILQVYSSQDVMTALPNDANIFATVSRDFKLFMRATEKNPNVLQCCQRKSNHQFTKDQNTVLGINEKNIM